ncbi:OsmC family protein [Lederbergia lenta]|uniref:OsmC family protein n=1 Tax=Lederbergia lenta TaxID=1467 RepID=A0A2X4VV59_LEDLE|nr:OsmC family protein [Lederbergia lenta]MEC2325575.1 OsmC family protein [Lederbergia lenta]SQI54219.1 OsmC family protein [Lederbergia lenta]
MEFNMKDGGFYGDFSYGRLDISGDEKYGIKPYQLLVSSVAVCSGGVLRKILEKMRMEVQDIQIKADAIRNIEKANRIESIKIHFDIKGKQLNEAKIVRAMNLTRKNCSMVQSVLGSIEVTETFKIIE